MKDFNPNRLFASVFIGVFSIMFADAVQEGDVVFSIIYAAIIIVEIIALTFGVHDDNQESPVSIKITKKED